MFQFGAWSFVGGLSPRRATPHGDGTARCKKDLCRQCIVLISRDRGMLNEHRGGVAALFIKAVTPFVARTCGRKRHDLANNGKTSPRGGTRRSNIQAWLNKAYASLHSSHAEARKSEVPVVQKSKMQSWAISSVKCSLFQLLVSQQSVLANHPGSLWQKI